MRITDFSKGAAWSIVPERFEALAQLAREAKPEKISEAIVTAGKSLDERQLYRVNDQGVAIIEINGPLAKNIDWFDRFVFGMFDYLDVQTAVKTALEDETVLGIVLALDSPGGTVNGVEEAAQAVFNARGQKPIVAFSSGMMASAAYRIGSAAEQIIIGKTAEAGSIGVLMIHTDWSRLEERIGIKTTYLTAGKYKALGNPSEPLSETARAEFQGQLDQLYTEFVETVALYRDVENDKALAMADGRIFIGERAVSVGLADEIGTLQAAVDWVLSAAEQQTDRRVFSMNGKLVEIKTYDDLKAAAPELLKTAEDKAFTLGSESTDMKPVQKAAADAEQVRLLGLATAFMGDEDGAKFAEIVKSGVSVEQFAAISKIQGGGRKQEDPEKKKILEALQATGATNPGAGGGNNGQKDYFALVAEYQRENKCSRVEAMKAVNKADPGARERMLNQANPHLAVAK